MIAYLADMIRRLPMHCCRLFKPGFSKTMIVATDLGGSVFAGAELGKTDRADDRFAHATELDWSPG